MPDRSRYSQRAKAKRAVPEGKTQPKANTNRAKGKPVEGLTLLWKASDVGSGTGQELAATQQAVLK